MTIISIRPTQESDEGGRWPAVSVEISGTFRIRELKAVARELLEAAEEAHRQAKVEPGSVPMSGDNEALEWHEVGCPRLVGRTTCICPPVEVEPLPWISNELPPQRTIREVLTEAIRLLEESGRKDKERG